MAKDRNNHLSQQITEMFDVYVYAFFQFLLIFLGFAAWNITLHLYGGLGWGFGSLGKQSFMQYTL